MSIPIRIVVADDHPIVRQGLRLSLAASREIEIVGEAGDDEAGLDQIRQLIPDVAILDVDLPKLDGFKISREIRKLSLPTKIIFLTLHNDAGFFRMAFNAGADGYILKDSGMEDIVAGIRSVMDGQMYVSPGMTRHLLEERNSQSLGQEKSLKEMLTPSERNVMRLIAEGKSSKEIGDDLGIHYRTVENHRSNMCRKLGIEGSNSLLRFALQNRDKL